MIEETAATLTSGVRSRIKVNLAEVLAKVTLAAVSAAAQSVGPQLPVPARRLARALVAADGAELAAAQVARAAEEMAVGALDVLLAALVADGARQRAQRDKMKAVGLLRITEENMACAACCL